MCVCVCVCVCRAGIRPFDQARAVFASLPDVPEDVKVKIEDEIKENVKVKTKTEGADILQLCNIIPLEVVGLGKYGFVLNKKGLWIFSPLHPIVLFSTVFCRLFICLSLVCILGL